MEIELTVNGEPVREAVDAGELLIDLLRDRLGLTGVKRSCDVQVCGACTVLLEGLPVSSCCTLAHEARGRSVTTIEGLAGLPAFGALERAFTRHAAVQCGYCTPGLLLTVHALLAEGVLRSDEEIRHGIAGNLCRCTGYKGILEAVRDVAGAAQL